ncbi:hypothetical protein FMM01_02795 [Schleiferilactobacillus harbinensis]|uniref:hypothetical protein n=1 Tax=Schleiferilactobacillus harbinensis TaxID=304207 RepID=UPI00123A4E2B|nr:hypothetical protein [Schleiferilactobacillus harbinensis]QEU46290.1 hypothetical protein FMM01_02795 [Schleiferilactobacillus harbinensis]
MKQQNRNEQSSEPVILSLFSDTAEPLTQLKIGKKPTEKKRGGYRKHVRFGEQQRITPAQQDQVAVGTSIFKQSRRDESGRRPLSLLEQREPTQNFSVDMPDMSAANVLIVKNGEASIGAWRCGFYESACDVLHADVLDWVPIQLIYLDAGCSGYQKSWIEDRS